MPFGLFSAPEEFHRREHEVHERRERNVEWITLLCFRCGETMEITIQDHASIMIAVLQRLHAVGLKLNKDKFKLCQA